MDAERDRTLRIEIPPCDVQKAPEEPEWTNLDALNGWQVTVPGSTVLHWEGTIDLSGYARDYKTFYPAGGVVQRGPYFLERDGEGSLTYTAISSTPLDPEEALYQLSGLGGPGFLNLNSISALGVGTNQQNWNQIIFAETEVNVPNINISPNTFGVQQPLERNQSGSLSPTAAQVLYCLKLVYPFAATGATRMSVPASRVILPGTMDQEPELEYMMRLSRSVQLANQV
jgi:hypothetical protein